MSKGRRTWRPKASVCAPLLKASQQWVYRMKIGSHGSFPSMMPCTHTFKASKSEPAPKPDLALVNAAGFLRSLGVGLLGVVLGIYLFRLGLSSLAIGLVVATGLAGSALATIAVSFAADRLGRKNSLLCLSLLSTMGGLALALSPRLP